MRQKGPNWGVLVDHPPVLVLKQGGNIISASMSNIAGKSPPQGHETALFISTEL